MIGDDDYDSDNDNGKDTKVVSLDDEDMVGEIVIKTSDGESFQLPRKIGFMSEFIKTIFQGDKTAESVVLENKDLNKQCFAKVLEYLAYHFDNPPKEIDEPLKTYKLEEHVSEFDAKFIDMKRDDLFAVTNAAHYLQIDSLVKLGCAKIACMLGGQKVEVMRDILGLENDFTEEEMAEMIKRDAWLDECK